ncbi:MAG: metallophosphoesterase family protein [Candidatus Diapherotrites archaeon]|nr:metallophosphoesterase family protein [Candidatus Diapherotrites archaeon]
MKVLFIADAHSNALAARRLKEKFSGAGIGLIAIAGDITDDGMAESAERVLNELDFAEKIIAVPGNMDGKQVVELLEKKGILLHKRKIEFGGYAFIGLGGAIPYHTFYKFSLGDLEAKKVLNGLLPGTNPKKTILVTHSPPYNVKIDLAGFGVHLGCREISRAIEKFQPLLHICAHVHEAKGEIEIGKTKSINVGPLKEGNALLAELNGKMKLLKVQFEI